MTGQVSIFEMLEEYETPTVSPDELKDGEKVWMPIIEGMYTGSIRDDAPIREVVGRACRIQIERDGRFFAWQEIDRKGCRGGTTRPEPMFRKMPTDRDILKWMHRVAEEERWTGKFTPETIWRVIDVRNMKGMKLSDKEAEG